jgi:signal transduction histidine kinase
MLKKIKSEAIRLQREAYDQIYFPKKDGKGLFFRYGLTAAFSLLLAEIAFLPKNLLGFESFLIIAILLISLISFIGSFNTGLLLTSVTVLLSFFSLNDPELSSVKLIEIVLTVTSAIVVNLIINIAKRADLGAEFGKREKYYIRQMEKITMEKKMIERELSAHDELISIASHELKTPLTSALLKLQIALDNIRNVSLANFSIQNLLDMLESAEQQAQTLGKMINDLLNLSLIKSGRLQLDFEDGDIGEITGNVVNRFTERAKKEQVKLEFFNTPGLVAIIDRIKIEQAITNLISNAIKYGQKKPVVVSVQKVSSSVRISVKDEGAGISRDVRDKIFNLYDRGTHQGNQTGLGIGLFVTNQIIIAHKGKLHLKTRENKGSEFTIELPLKK